LAVSSLSTAVLSECSGTRPVHSATRSEDNLAAHNGILSSLLQ
jgi:hypothetical protein